MSSEVKKFHTIRKPIHDFLSNFLLHFFSLVPFSRYLTSKFLGFDLDLWPLKDIWGQKFFYPFESSYMTSYLTFNDTFSLSGAVFGIFDFNLFKVWFWPLTSKGHQRSKNFIPFESPYVTSYLTSIDTYSLSRTVFEIFDFKLFRVWPWPLTSEGHPKSKIFIPFEKPIHDFLCNFHWHFFSLVPFLRYLTSNFLGFDLDLWPLKVIKGQKISYSSKAHTWFLI